MVDVAGADVVAVLTRAPSAGGKARLFSALGVAPDKHLLWALLLDTLDNVAVDGVVTVVAVTPATACGELIAAAPGVAVIPQPEGSTLGDRMSATMALLLSGGARRVALVGSDLPSITPAHVTAAFAALAADPHAVVLGPAADGGYYLVAGTIVPPIFNDCEWGTSRVLDQTRRAAAAVGMRVHLLETLADVDTPEDLRRAVQGANALRTRAWWTASGLT